MIPTRDYYRLLQTPFGDIGLVWTETTTTFRLRRIFLPPPDCSVSDRVMEAFPDVAAGSSANADKLSNNLTQNKSSGD